MTDFNLPLHRHTGSDSLQVEFTDLVNSQMYAKYALISLTPAQIKALNTTPITIVPAVVAGYIIVDSIFAKNRFISSAYTGANNLEFRYTDAGGTKVTADMANTFINSASTAFDHVGGVVSELTPVVSTPIVVRVPTANPGTGLGIISFLIKYRVLNIN